MPPYSGVVQIAETRRARAQSFDGVSWEIHYLPDDGRGDDQHRERGYALNRSYFHVAKLQATQLMPYIFPSFLDAADITSHIDQLAEFLSEEELPFPAVDNFEYWLLDCADDSPLALIFSCCEHAQMASYPSRSAWTALPHSKMQVMNTPEEIDCSEVPVNDRLQRLVTQRAGPRPRAAWFNRQESEPDIFPGLLVREDWQSQIGNELCQRYLQRKSPRLLMLQGLSHDERERMEVAAKQFALEVAGYFPLYPRVNDEQRMAAIRVEARLRGHAPSAARSEQKDSSKTPKPFSKEMRILE